MALIVAACDNGDDDAGTDGGATTTEAAGPREMGPAELTAEDQSGDGTTVVVTSVTLPANGFLVIHADAEGGPGPVIGHTALLEAGTSSDVEVPLDEALTTDATVWPMAHIDTNGNEQYDFNPPESTEDGPATFENGDVAVVSISYTLEDGGTSSGAAVTAENFAFSPSSTEVAAGATVTWTNNDSVQHTVTAGEPGSETGEFDEPLEAGGTAEVTFDSAGTFMYFCKIHPSMTAEVVVS